MTAPGAAALERPARLEEAAFYALLAFAIALQFSIAAAGILLTLTGLLWLALVITGRERVEVPWMFWPLAAYGGATLVAALFSVDPSISFFKSKQLVLFILVPIVYRLARGERALTVVDVVITVGALNALFGIVQFSLLRYDNIHLRPQGNLMYMTYSGVLMLVACTAAARVLFRRQDRLWAALVMPALLVALAVSQTRSAWVGGCAGIGLLLAIRDFRLLALLPVAAAIFISVAPVTVTDRFYAAFQLTEGVDGSDTVTASVASNRDRLAMARSGARIVRDHPWLGLGPDMLQQVYPQYRDAMATNQHAIHLHNVPLQIAAERGLPALALWLWFVLTLLREFLRRRTHTAFPSLPTTGLAVVVAMFAAGMFEYNFGDSEFLMLFLILVTLPYAADRPTADARSVQSARPAA
jgi:putative inorganic carbon (hco3(-)) transporter